jgi:hypothetical protein
LFLQLWLFVRFTLDCTLKLTVLYNKRKESERNSILYFALAAVLITIKVYINLLLQQNGTAPA